MNGKRAPRHSPDEMLDGLLRNAREPFASIVDEYGLAGAVRIFVRSSRKIIEASPQFGGELNARGVRDPGALWLAGEEAEQLRDDLAEITSEVASEKLALIPARIFAAIAYRHPYFDGNKRTAFLAALFVGRYLGLGLRPEAFEGIEDAILALTSREAPDDEVARWLLAKVFMPMKSDWGKRHD